MAFAHSSGHLHQKGKQPNQSPMAKEPRGSEGGAGSRCETRRAGSSAPTKSELGPEGTSRLQRGPASRMTWARGSRTRYESPGNAKSSTPDENRTRIQDLGTSRCKKSKFVCTHTQNGLLKKDARHPAGDEREETNTEGDFVQVTRTENAQNADPPRGTSAKLAGEGPHPDGR